MDFFIVTGASKGLGFSIVKKLILKGDSYIVCFSRHKNKEIEDLSLKNNVLLKYIEIDITDLECVEQTLIKIFQDQILKKINNFYLINNAAIISPLKPLIDIKPEEFMNNFKTNFIAALYLTIGFLKYSIFSKSEKFIVNISSKSAVVPIKNWVCYSTSKAALDNLTKYIAVEYKSNVKSISFYPPAMETSMREEHLKSKNIFSRIWDFILVKIFKRKKVYSPDEIVDKILDIILNKKFNSGSIIDLS